MRKIILLYGLSLAALIFLLKVLEYRFLVRELALEFYIGIIAVFFMALGIWAGVRLKNRKHIVVVSGQAEFKVQGDLLKQTGISKREYEVLELMSQGNSNQQIADKLFVSLNTVKTHTSNLFLKLDARRRTQAIQRAKALHLLP